MASKALCQAYCIAVPLLSHHQSCVCDLNHAPTRHMMLVLVIMSPIFLINIDFVVKIFSCGLSSAMSGLSLSDSTALTSIGRVFE